jgi:serine/threonine protein kinase, bacterial
MIGQLLAGRYQVLQVLGAGGFGQTYITEDLHLPGQPKCVLKHLRPANTSPEVMEIARKLFQKEAETLQQLGSHDQIPRLLAYFEENREFFLVQEYIVGHTLTAELGTNQRWIESAVQRLLREVLTILEFVHGRGVIHRDVKPDNIMRRDADGKLVLIDFGAIKQVRNQQYSQFGEVTKTISIGTPGYMPLEQAGGTPRPSSDLYALGMICVQALTGRHPTELTEDEATGELQWQHLVTLSPPLAAFITKITSYHFKDRYVTAYEALQALQQINSGINPTLSQGNVPAQMSPSTAATRVVAPADSSSGSPPSGKPSTNNLQFPVSAARPDEPRRRSSGSKLLMSLAILTGTAGVGYFGVRPLLMADQFDTLVATTDRCRVAAPNKDSKFITKVREKPDRTAQVKAKLTQGAKLLYVADQEEFVQIEQRNGEQGWVFNDQIRRCNATAPTPTPSPSLTPASPDSPSPPPTVKPKPSVAPKSPSPIKKTPTPTPSSSSLDDPTITPDPPVSPLPSKSVVKPPSNNSPPPSPTTPLPPPSKSPSPQSSVTESPTPPKPKPDSPEPEGPIF